MNTNSQKLPSLPPLEPGVANVHPVLASQEILQGANEVRIAHCGCVYSLRVTRQGKLILTK